MRVLLTGSFVAGLFVLFLACSGSDTTTNIPSEAGATSSSGSTGAGTSGSSGTSGSTSGGTSGTSSGSTGTSGTNTGGDCTQETQAGQSVDIISTKAEKPNPTGGAPVEGKFVLKQVRAFAAIFSEGTVIRAFGAYTLILKNGATAFEQVVTNKDGVVTEAKGKLEVTAPNKFKATPDCETPPPDGGGVTILAGEYTVENPMTIKMYVVRELNITAELTFEKQ
jgi:hypothetical protein